MGQPSADRETYSRQCVERLAGLDRRVACAGAYRSMATSDIERVQLDAAPPDAADVVGGYEGIEPEPKNGSMTIAATSSWCNKRSKSRGSNAPLQARHRKYIGITQ
jgi:hypothetical protein